MIHLIYTPFNNSLANNKYPTSVNNFKQKQYLFSFFNY